MLRIEIVRKSDRTFYSGTEGGVEVAHVAVAPDQAGMVLQGFGKIAHVMQLLQRAVEDRH